MKKPNITELIYQKTFPKPKQGEPVNFYAHVQRNIIPEVRVEVQTYYGALDTLEAQYPGLDYTFAPHRRRLARLPWHRRLFRAFDELGMTDNERLSLCGWEGTRAAKERYEREAGVQVRTTTADDVVAAPIGNGPNAMFEDLSRPASSSDETTVAADKEYAKSKELSVPPGFVGLLRDAMHSRLQGDSAHINQAWEQWLKETLESHDEIDIDSVMTAIQNLEPETFGVLQEPASGENDISRSSMPQSPAAETFQEHPRLQTQSSRFTPPMAELVRGTET